MPSKRKRASTLPSKKTAVEMPQPSSRDASGEDAEDPILREVSNARNKKSESESAQDPPAKRTRSAKNEAVTRRLSEGESKRPNAASQNTDASTPTIKVHPNGYRTNPPPLGRPVRVYADGVFDLFHLGHMRQLEQAKKAFPEVYLIVGVTGDKETHRRKGLTVLSGKERAESVRHCKWVDEVIEDCPWVVTVEFMEQHAIDYVAHDDLPYGADEGDDIYAPIKAQGKFLVTQRTEGVSTTGIITKIVRDYEKYISRQLKRGTTRRELNVSWLKKNEIDVKQHLAELRDNIRMNWTTTGQEIGKDLWQFWQASRPTSPNRKSEAQNAAGLPRSAEDHTSFTMSRLRKLEIPRGSGGSSSNTSEFITGYMLGLIGGVRSWMTRSRRSLNDGEIPSPDSPNSSSGARSPEESPTREQHTTVEGQLNHHVGDEMDLNS